MNRAMWHSSNTGRLGHVKFFSREFSFTHPIEYVSDKLLEKGSYHQVSLANSNATSENVHVETQDEDKEGKENINIASLL